MSDSVRDRFWSASRYVVLGIAAFAALSPIALIVMNSLKNEKAIFGDPLALPSSTTLSVAGYQEVLGTDFFRMVANSVIVTGTSVAAVLLVTSMASFALARYAFPGRSALTFYLVMGIFLPTTLGSVAVLSLFADLGLINNLLSLVLVYTAQAIPLSVFILVAFFREIPGEILDAGRVDGAGEFRLFVLILPLVRPALAAVGVLTMIPVWNDIWWPLLLAPSPETRTLILGTQNFVGLYDTDWSALLSVLTLAMIPVLLVFAFFSRQLIRGVTAGALK